MIFSSQLYLPVLAPEILELKTLILSFFFFAFLY